MTDTLSRGALLRDVAARTDDGREVHVSDFRGRRNIVLIFPGEGEEASSLIRGLGNNAEVQSEEAVVLTASEATARAFYSAPSSAVFIADRYGEIFFSARHPDPLPDAAEVLKWLEFINSQCPE